jgi:hypothetical protein
MNTEETTNTLVTKMSNILEREVSPFEVSLIEWVVTQVQLQLLEEEQA